MSKEFIILGSGPSGMMAAHAVYDSGYTAEIYDKDPDQSRRNSGVFVLHDNCNLGLDPIEIRQFIIGAVGISEEHISEIYTSKVYGDTNLPKKVSVLSALKNPSIIGYDANIAVQRLWDLYSSRVVKAHIDKGLLNSFLSNDLYVISTIPAYQLLDINVTEFTYKRVCVKVSEAPKGEAPFILYNINRHMNWYRCSAISGVFTKEYNHGEIIISPNNSSSIRDVKKVVGNGFTHPNKRVLLTGRYGAWNKSILTHNVYYQVLEWIKNI